MLAAVPAAPASAAARGARPLRGQLGPQAARLGLVRGGRGGGGLLQRALVVRNRLQLLPRARGRAPQRVRPARHPLTRRERSGHIDRFLRAHLLHCSARRSAAAACAPAACMQAHEQPSPARPCWACRGHGGTAAQAV